MTGDKSCIVCKIVKLVASVAAINWALAAFMGLNLVEKALGSGTAASKVAYGVIGLAGLMLLGSFCNLCPCQKKEGCCPPK